MIRGTRLSRKSGGECLECDSRVYMREHLGTILVCSDRKANIMPCEGSLVPFAMVFGIFDLNDGGYELECFAKRMRTGTSW